jgi:hypothetical protein
MKMQKTTIVGVLLNLTRVRHCKYYCWRGSSLTAHLGRKSSARDAACDLLSSANVKGTASSAICMTTYVGCQ